MKFNERLKTLRNELGLTQKELGEKIGVGRTTISEYESGKIVPRQDGLIKLAEVLNVTVDYLTCNHDVREILPTPMKLDKTHRLYYNIDVQQQLARMIRNLHIGSYNCRFGDVPLTDTHRKMLTNQLKNVMDLMRIVMEDDL